MHKERENEINPKHKVLVAAEEEGEFSGLVFAVCRPQKNLVKNMQYMQEFTRPENLLKRRDFVI